MVVGACEGFVKPWLPVRGVGTVAAEPTTDAGTVSDTALVPSTQPDPSTPEANNPRMAGVCFIVELGGDGRSVLE
jgi:hypothetical protein